MSAADFERSLVDGAQLVSVVLVFLSVLFGIKYQRIVDALMEDIPAPERANERVTFRKRQMRCLLSDVLVVAVPFLFLVIVFGPPSLRIIGQSTFTLWNIDLVRTLFLAEEAFMLVALIWLTFAGSGLFRRARYSTRD